MLRREKTLLILRAPTSLVCRLQICERHKRQREAEEMGVEGRDHSVLIHYMDYVEHRMSVGEVEAGRPTRKLMQQSK